MRGYLQLQSRWPIWSIQCHRTLCHVIYFSHLRSSRSLKMSFSSRPKKLKLRPTIPMMRIVQTVDRNGMDTVKTERVKAPQSLVPNVPSTRASTTQPTSQMSSIKRRKIAPVDSDVDPIPFRLEDLESVHKRQTLVCFLTSHRQIFF